MKSRGVGLFGMFTVLPARSRAVGLLELTGVWHEWLFSRAQELVGQVEASLALLPPQERSKLPPLVVMAATPATDPKKSRPTKPGRVY
jgi:hypothetical protein